MNEQRRQSAYSDTQWRRAVFLSAFLGWGIVVIPFVAVLGVSVIPIAAVIGLPLALAACWIVVAPILSYAMRKPVTWARAAVWGFISAFSINAFISIFTKLYPWLRSRSSQLGGGDKVQSIDGVLTPYGWWVYAQSSASFIASGIVVALIIRAVIGPGANDELTEVIK